MQLAGKESIVAKDFVLSHTKIRGIMNVQTLWGIYSEFTWMKMQTYELIQFKRAGDEDLVLCEEYLDQLSNIGMGGTVWGPWGGILVIALDQSYLAF